MLTTLLIIFFIILIFLIFMCNRTKKIDYIRGGAVLDIEPEQISNEFKDKINIPSALQYIEYNIVAGFFAKPFYNLQVTSFYNLNRYPMLQPFFYPILSELTDISKQISISQLKGAYTEDNLNDIYVDLKRDPDDIAKKLINRLESSYPNFIQYISVTPDRVVYNDVNKTEGVLSNALAAILLIAAEYDYHKLRLPIFWGDNGKILLLFLLTYIMKYDIKLCKKTNNQIDSLLYDIIRGYPDVINYYINELDSDQLFKEYKIRLKDISNNESKGIFSKKVIKEGLLKLQQEGIKLEKILEQEKNKENLDHLKCIQNRVRNKIKSL